MKMSDTYIKNMETINKLIVQPPSKSNVENVSKIGKVIFDQIHGIGQTSYNQNVLYKGFAAVMYPEKFIELALPTDKYYSVKHLKEELKAGKAIGSPFLIVEVSTDDESVGLLKVVGHEGRNRCKAIQELYKNNPILVHFIVRHGNYKDLNQHILETSMHTILSEKGNDIIQNPITKIISNVPSE